MTIRQFKYFLKIVRCGSINKAAIQLNITQQSLLASMNSLEKSLGFSVFSRSKSGVSLTSRGQAILNDVQRIVDICSTWAQFMDDDSAARLPIRIAGTSSMINLILGKAVLYLKEKYPNVAIELHERKKDELMQMVVEDHMIGLCGAIAPEELENFRVVLEKNGMRIEVMGADDYAVIINSRHPLASRGVLRTEDLGQFTAALYPHDDHKFFYSGIYQYFSREHAPYYGSKQESLLNIILRDATVAAVFPVSVARNPNVPPGSLKGMFVEDCPMPGLNCLVFPREDRLSPVEKAILESFREVYRKERL
ncbi:LysR family transcriptional regulator [Mailhella massiliensis]|uniref:LysR family transcriptional regulator n=1 Tax=Mailhella massiliensis TaxID=1903261 RepID=UPI0023F0B215|nr:LysR family transcriptional regulator [Mailhella massiliensis]